MIVTENKHEKKFNDARIALILDLLRDYYGPSIPLYQYPVYGTQGNPVIVRLFTRQIFSFTSCPFLYFAILRLIFLNMWFCVWYFYTLHIFIPFITYCVICFTDYSHVSLFLISDSFRPLPMITRASFSLLLVFYMLAKLFHWLISIPQSFRKSSHSRFISKCISSWLADRLLFQYLSRLFSDFIILVIWLNKFIHNAFCYCAGDTSSPTCVSWLNRLHI